MAFKKSINTPYGVTAGYWRIANKLEDFVAGAVKVMLAGYVCEEARRAQAQPLASVEVILSGADYAGATVDGNRAALYAAIQAQPAWADAEAC